MCDPECVKRFERVELKINSMSNDIKWFKWLIRSVILIVGSYFGVDMAGIV